MFCHILLTTITRNISYNLPLRWTFYLLLKTERNSIYGRHHSTSLAPLQVVSLHWDWSQRYYILQDTTPSNTSLICYGIITARMLSDNQTSSLMSTLSDRPCDFYLFNKPPWGTLSNVFWVKINDVWLSFIRMYFMHRQKTSKTYEAWAFILVRLYCFGDELSNILLNRITFANICSRGSMVEYRDLVFKDSWQWLQICFFESQWWIQSGRRFC